VERQVAERVRASTPGNVWSRLNAIDFMNSSMVVSALGGVGDEAALPFG
jgi:hypothetical protein